MNSAMIFIADILIGIPALYVVYRIGIWLYMLLLFKSPFRDLPGPPSKSWVMGNLGELFNAKGMPFHLSLVDIYGGMVRVFGFFGDEQLYIADPLALQSVLIADQASFEETSVFIETNKVIFGPGLVATTGEQHKRQRRALNPTFAVPQLRRLTSTFYEISEKLADVFEREIQEQTLGAGNESPVLDMFDWMSRVALESVGRAVLGYSFDPLDSSDNNPYTSAIKELIPTLFQLSLIRQFAPFLAKLGPPAFRRKIVEWTPHPAVQQVKDMSDVMHETAQQILQHKREELQRSNDDWEARISEEKDAITALLKANDRVTINGGEQLSDAELTGQMTVLIFGAQDTTSSCLSRILHLLAQHPEVQDNVRREIQAKLQDKTSRLEQGRLSYDAVSNLAWLDAVLKESLRLYPPVPFVRRTAIKGTVLSFSKGKGGISYVNVPVGTTLFVSIAGSNRLESIWGTDAKKWKPERWLETSTELKGSSSARLPGIYSGMLSFLGGNRSCVGYKFAQIEMKIILVTLISRFKFSCSDEEHNIVWNLSQIISPALRTKEPGGKTVEKKALPLIVKSVVSD